MQISFGQGKVTIIPRDLASKQSGCKASVSICTCSGSVSNKPAQSEKRQGRVQKSTAFAKNLGPVSKGASKAVVATVAMAQRGTISKRRKSMCAA